MFDSTPNPPSLPPYPEQFPTTIFTCNHTSRTVPHAFQNGRYHVFTLPHPCRDCHSTFSEELIIRIYARYEPKLHALETSIRNVRRDLLRRNGTYTPYDVGRETGRLNEERKKVLEWRDWEMLQITSVFEDIWGKGILVMFPDRRREGNWGGGF
jgi:hypothetical protein